MGLRCLAMALAVKEAMARSKQEAAERKAKKEAEAAEAAALIAKAEAAEAWDRKKRAELKQVMVPNNERKAFAVVEKCPSKLFVETDDEGMTALHHAAANGLASCCEAILRRRDYDQNKVLAGDVRGRTPLHHAVLTDSKELKACRALVKQSNLEARDNEGRTPLQTAQHWGLAETAAFLHTAEATRRKELAAKIKVKDTFPMGMKGNSKDVGYMAGIAAITEGRIDDARALMDTMPFVNQVDSAGNTVLHLAALHGHEDLCEAILRRPDFTDYDVLNKEHATALHLAVGNRQTVCVRAIIESGRFSAVNERDLLDRTALHLAALRSDAEAYEAIVAHPECRPGIPDRYGKSAAEYAAERGMDVELPVPELEIDL